MKVDGRDPKDYEISGDKPLKIRAGEFGFIKIRAQDELRIDHWEVMGKKGNAGVWLLPLICLFIPLLVAGIVLVIREVG